MSKDNKTLYDILGVSRSADADRIKRAYWQKARECHPDMEGDQRDSERFCELSDAYDTLKDSRKRKAYDRRMDGVSAPARTADDFRQQSPGPGVRGPVQLLESMEQLLQRLFRRPSRQRIEHETELHYDVIMTPEEARNGSRAAIPLRMRVSCLRCGGTGSEGDWTCTVCGGSGRTAEKREISIDLPAGLRHGSESDFMVRESGLPPLYIHLRVLIRGAASRANR